MKRFLTHIIYPLFTLIFCIGLFCSATFSWFCDQSTSDISQITTASYSLSVEIKGRLVGICSSLEDLSYCCLDTDKDTDSYIFTLTAQGTAEKGYCEIYMDDTLYETISILQNQTKTLTISADPGTKLTFSAHWGVAPDTTMGISSIVDTQQAPDKIIEPVEYDDTSDLEDTSAVDDIPVSDNQVNPDDRIDSDPSVDDFGDEQDMNNDPLSDHSPSQDQSQDTLDEENLSHSIAE